jgi:uncharacterized protein DUF885
MTTPIEKIWKDFFGVAAEQFPIASASDEFFYFPQVRSEKKDWSRWDAFSEDAVEDFARKLKTYERALVRIEKRHANMLQEDIELQIDHSLLFSTITTLREQLTEVRSWQTQPTFFLTIACLGIAEALEADDSSAAVARAETLPAFIDSAGHSLRNMPGLFRDLGLSMLRETRRYFGSLAKRLPALKKSLPRLESLAIFLREAKTRSDFRMPDDLLEKVIRHHLNCRLDIASIFAALDEEIHDMQTVLARQAKAMSAETPWEYLMGTIPLPVLPAGGLVGLYHEQVQALAEHCVSIGILSESMLSGCPVRVRPVPSFLSAIRTASSYSIQPEHPPRGGIFYVIHADNPAEARKTYQREYRILSAHETYPGHHFLDCVRLHDKRTIRRCIEKPIFYEGWACFAETLMQLTGYLDNAYEHMLLARRRLWRAIRGKIDLGLQTGRIHFEAAVDDLVRTGTSPGDAAAVVRKYPLNPGYQLCYTLGFKGFLSLYRSYGKQDMKGFVKRAVSQGEIDLEDLERLLRRRH